MMSRVSLRTGNEPTARWRRVAKDALLPCLIILVWPFAARGETIYALSYGFENADLRLLKFDSSTPWEIEESLPINGEIAGTEISLEFDPVTQELFGFAFYQCQVLCPAIATIPMKFDLLTGDLSYLEWPGLPAIEYGPSDKDIDPFTRELRLFSQSGENFRYSITTLESHVDSSLSIPGYAFATAHMSRVEMGGGVETFAIFWSEADGIQLARIGGVGGTPPASSGEVALIGPVEVQGYINGFDISPSGEAFLSTHDFIALPGDDFPSHVSWLYAINLSTGDAQELGIIATPEDSYVGGIAVAGVLASSYAEVPTLSQIGLVTLSLLLASSALWQLRLKFS